MEYSVYDLIRILFRKWYIILLSMCVMGGLSAVTAQRSYAQALADYEVYTSQTVPAAEQTGTLTALYQYRVAFTDMTRYVNQWQNKQDFTREYLAALQEAGSESGPLPAPYSGAELAYARACADFTALLTDSSVMKALQTATQAQSLTEPGTDGTVLTAANHLSVEQLNESTLRITVSGLNEVSATLVLESYLDSLTDEGRRTASMDISLEEMELAYAVNSTLTDTAQFSQKVMQKPEQVPMLMKAVGTAAAFSFVVACFLILLGTFVKDTHPLKTTAPEEG